jgi:hypothetical protein
MLIKDKTLQMLKNMENNTEQEFIEQEVEEQEEVVEETQEEKVEEVAPADEPNLLGLLQMKHTLEGKML